MSCCLLFFNSGLSSSSAITSALGAPANSSANSSGSCVCDRPSSPACFSASSLSNCSWLLTLVFNSSKAWSLVFSPSLPVVFLAMPSAINVPLALNCSGVKATLPLSTSKPTFPKSSIFLIALSLELRPSAVAKGARIVPPTSTPPKPAVP